VGDQWLQVGQAFPRLGCEVTIIASRDHLLPKKTLEEVVHKQFESEGIRVLIQTKVERVEIADRKKTSGQVGRKLSLMKF